jgi:hypothetical protein
VNPVRLLALRPNCDCVSAAVAKEQWEPGEEGVVHVVFTAGGRTGLQDRTVTVTTDDAPDKPVVLRLLIDIPEDVLVRPRTLVWEVGSKADEKQAELMVMDTGPATEVGVQCPDERFQARVDATKQAGVFRVLVRPLTTSVPAQTVVRVTLNLAGRPQVYLLTAVVK